MTNAIHYAMDAHVYHSDPCPEPSLSSGLANVLNQKSPAHAWHSHPKLNPNYRERTPSAEMFYGTLCHALMTGRGEIVVGDFDSFRTKVAQEWRDSFDGTNRITILRSEFNRAKINCQAVSKKLVALGLDRVFDERRGRGEVVFLWRDFEGGWCRAMADWWDEGENVLYDLKTTSGSMSPRALALKIADGYDLQAAWYVRGLVNCRPELEGRVKFRWIFAETAPPYDVVVVEADNATLDIGTRKAKHAIRKFHQCLTTGEWPGSAPGIIKIEYPIFAETQWMERELAEVEEL